MSLEGKNFILWTKGIPETKEINLRLETEFELSGGKEGMPLLFLWSLPFLFISTFVFLPPFQHLLSVLSELGLRISTFHSSPVTRVDLRSYTLNKKCSV